jgi:hypothetical protein
MNAIATAETETTMVFGEGLSEPQGEKVMGFFPDASLRALLIAETEVTASDLALIESTPMRTLTTWSGQATAGLGVTVRHGRHLADYILRLLPESEHEVFLREVLYAACEGLEKLDWWPLAETMNGWEATAEVEENPRFARELDQAITAYRADQ